MSRVNRVRSFLSPSRHLATRRRRQKRQQFTAAERLEGRGSVRRRQQQPGQRIRQAEKLEDRTLLTSGGLEFVISDVTVEEGTDSHAILEVTLVNGPSAFGAGVNWEAHSDFGMWAVGARATSGDDYCSSSGGGGGGGPGGPPGGGPGGTSCVGVLSFGPSETVKYISVDIVDDSLTEIDEYFWVELSDPWATGGVVLADGVGTVKILDNNGIGGSGPAINIQDAVVDEDAGTATVEVTLSEPTVNTVTVDYATVDGDAAQIDDYTHTTGELTFGPNETSKSITVSIVDDNVAEDDETFDVVLSNPTFAHLGRSTGEVLIIDDDGDPDISIGDELVAEDDGTVTLDVTLSHPSASTVSVDWTTVGGTAVAVDDYTHASGTISFAPSETTKTVTVTIVDDAVAEETEEFSVVLSNAVNGIIDDDTAVVTIDDDDAVYPFISIGDEVVNEADGTVTLTVSLNEAGAEDVTLNYETRDDTALKTADYTETTGSLTFTVGQTEKTITVPILQDSVLEPDEFFEVWLLNVTKAHVADGIAEVTIEDDEVLTVGIQATFTVSEGNSAAPVVTLSQSVGWPITVNYTTQDVTALAPIDYTSTTDSITIPANTTSLAINSIPTILDNLAEPTETFLVKLISADADIVGDTSTVSITDVWNPGTPTPPDVPDGPALIDPFQLVNDTGNSTDLITRDPDVEGRVLVDGLMLAGTSVELDWDRDSQADGSATTDSNGWFNYSPPSSLEYGDVVMRARAQNGDDIWGDWFSLRFMYVEGATFSQDAYHVGIREGISPSDWEYEMPMLVPDGGAITLSITDGNPNLGDLGGSPNYLFDISYANDTATLTYQQVLDFEYDPRYELTLEATQNGHVHTVPFVLTVHDAPSPGVPILGAPPATTDDSTPEISWNEPQHADFYKIEVFDPNGVQTAHLTDSTSYTLPTISTEGIYSVRVQAYNDVKEDGEWSIFESFRYDTIPNPEITHVTAPTIGTSDLTPTFTWENPSHQSSTYLRIVDENGNVTTPLTTGTSYTPAADMAVGQYTVQVKHVNTFGESWSGAGFNHENNGLDWSEPHRFAVGAKTLLVTDDTPWVSNADSQSEVPSFLPRSGHAEGALAIDDLTGALLFDPTLMLHRNAGLTATGFSATHETRTAAALGWIPVYNSAWEDGETIISANIMLPETTPTTVTVRAKLGSGSFSNDKVYTVGTDTELQVAVAAINTSLSTGLHDYTLEVELDFPDSTSATTTITGTVTVVDRSDSPFGIGFWVPRLSDLHIYDSTGPLGEGALLVRGNGTSAWFAKDNGDFLTPDGSFTRLEADGSDYRLIFPQGEEHVFNSSGRLIEMLDTRGRSIDVDRSGADLDSVTLPISDQVLSYTYGSTDDLLDTINDFSGRTWTFDHTVAGRTTSVRAPADGENAGQAEAALDWDVELTVSDLSVGTRDWVVEWTNEGAVASLERPDGTDWVQNSIYGMTVAAGAVALADLIVETEDRTSGGTIRRTTSQTLDRFGYPLTSTNTHDMTTVTERNRDGQVTASYIDVTNPLITTYSYTDWGALSRTLTPENVERRWEYADDSFLPTKVIDGNGIATRYTYHNGNFGPENAIYETLVGRGSSWAMAYFTATVTTTHVYDTASGELARTIADPANGPSFVAEYDIDADGWISSIDTPGVGAVEYTYSDEGLLLERTDALGGEWDYEYDDHGRLIEQTWPLVNGSRYFTTTDYDRAGRMTESTERDLNKTNYEYDNRDRITLKRLPDPGTGDHGRPEYTWTYNDDRYTETNPANGTTTYHYQDYDPRTVRKIVRDDGSYMEYWFDDHGWISDIRNWWGGIWLCGRDNSGRLTSMEHPESNEHLIYVYDGEDRVTQEYWASSASAQIGDSNVSFGTATTFDDFGNVLIVDQVGTDTQNWNFYGHLGKEIRQQVSPTEDDPLPQGKDWFYDGWYRVAKTYDSVGNMSEWEYDPTNPSLVRKRYLPDPDGDGPLPRQYAEWFYDILGRPVSYRDYSGLTTTTQYDVFLRVAQTTQDDPDGSGPLDAPETHTLYDGLGRVISSQYLSGAENRTTTWNYDVMNHRVKQTDPNPGNGAVTPITQWVYDDMGRLTSTTDPRGHVTATVYDADGDYHVTAADNGTTDYEVDLLGRLAKTTDPAGNVVNVEYDEQGQVTKRFGTGGQETFIYGIAGEQLSHTGADGTVTTTVYDEFLRPIERTAQGITHYTEYDAVGRVAATGTSTNNMTTFEFDDLGRTIFVNDPQGYFTATEYDSDGRVSLTRDETGATTFYTYDDLNRVQLITDAVRTRERYYDDGGNLWIEQDPRDPSPYTQGPNQFAWTYHEYDDLDREVRRKDPNSGYTDYEYDANGNRTAIVDPGQDNGTRNRTDFDYDELNRLEEETNEEGGIRSWTYNTSGLVATETDRNGRTTTYTYEFDFDGGSNYRRKKEIWSDGHTIEWFYTSDDRVDRIAETGGDEIDYAWNSQGLMSQVAQTISGVTITIDYLYDSQNRVDRVTATQGVTTLYINEFEYDELDRVIEIEQSGGGLTSKRVEIAYTSTGQVDQIDRYEGSTFIATSEYVYDTLGRLTNLTYHDDEDILTFFEWSYGIDFNVDQFVTSDGYDQYDYDDADQLREVNSSYRDPADVETLYEYDANGNRTEVNQVAWSHDDANRLTFDGVYNYEYDAEGNRTRKYSTALDVDLEYQWDHRNRMTDVIWKTNAGTVTKTVTYGYDTNNRRTSKVVDVSGTVTTTLYVWDSDHNTLVLDASGNADQTNLYGAAVDHLFAMETSASDVFWTFTDNQNTVRDVAEYDAGETTVIVHRQYDAFGNLIEETNPDDPVAGVPVTIAAGYTGREWDSDSELYYYRARWYDPRAGRFVNEDPIGFDAGDVNVQRYVANNAPNAVDPSGNIIVFKTRARATEFLAKLRSNGITHARLFKVKGGKRFGVGTDFRDKDAVFKYCRQHFPTFGLDFRKDDPRVENARRCRNFIAGLLLAPHYVVQESLGGEPTVPVAPEEFGLVNMHEEYFSAQPAVLRVDIGGVGPGTPTNAPPGRININLGDRGPRGRIPFLVPKLDEEEMIPISVPVFAFYFQAVPTNNAIFKAITEAAELVSAPGKIVYQSNDNKDVDRFVKSVEFNIRKAAHRRNLRVDLTVRKLPRNGIRYVWRFTKKN